MGARGRQQRLAGAELFLEQGMAFFGKLAVARQLAIDDRLPHKVKLLSRKKRAIKAEIHGSASAIGPWPAGLAEGHGFVIAFTSRRASPATLPAIASAGCRVLAALEPLYRQRCIAHDLSEPCTHVDDQRF